MPPWGSTVGGELTDAEILAVVCHERYAFNGPDINEDEAAATEFENWCSEESPIFEALEAGVPLADLSDETDPRRRGRADQDPRHRRCAGRGHQQAELTAQT